MKILVLNSGSSSIKFKLYGVHEETGNFSALCAGVCERIGITGSTVHYQYAGHHNWKTEVADFPNHRHAVDKILKLLTGNSCEALKHPGELDGVGHRVVHGGEDFTASVLINHNVIEAIKRNAILAPLHNPPNLMGIRAVSVLMPDLPQVAVFDTAVHQSMPKKAYLYALPRAQYSRYKIRKYGFHGISHGYVAGRAAEELNSPLKKLKLITCHLGNGASLAAFQNGVSIDTSMGFTPLDGVMMGTRSGTIDPYVPLHIMESQVLKTAQVGAMMNQQSGLFAISGRSDMRDNIQGAAEGDEACRLAIEMFCYSIQKYIGSYIAAMNGVDAIIFTAGMGENSPMIREKILENFTFFGLQIDSAKNAANKTLLTAENSKVAALKIHTDEEQVIAFDTYCLIKAQSSA